MEIEATVDRLLDNTTPTSERESQEATELFESICYSVLLDHVDQLRYYKGGEGPFDGLQVAELSMRLNESDGSHLHVVVSETTTRGVHQPPGIFLTEYDALGSSERSHLYWIDNGLLRRRDFIEEAQRNYFTNVTIYNRLEQFARASNQANDTLKEQMHQVVDERASQEVILEEERDLGFNDQLVSVEEVGKLEYLFAQLMPWLPV